MALLDTLSTDLKVAMKARDKAGVRTIRLLISEMKNAAIAKGAALTAEDELQLLATQAKRRSESIEAYGKGGREDLVTSEREELEVIQGYLPEPLTADQVRELVAEAIAATGASGMRDMGKVMGRVMPQVKGRFPGKEVRPIVQGLLDA